MSHKYRCPVVLYPRRCSSFEPTIDSAPKRPNQDQHRGHGDTENTKRRGNGRHPVLQRSFAQVFLCALCVSVSSVSRLCRFALHSLVSMTYDEAIEYLKRFELSGIKLGLERMQALCAAAGHPERAFPAVLVGGTNGKGSVCTMLAAILEAAGQHVGLSPKPHLYDLRERFQVNGAMIERAEFAA